MTNNSKPKSTKKKIFLTIVILVLTLPSAAVVFMAWSGFFSNAKVSEQRMGPYCLIYADYSGPYGGARSTMDSIQNVLQKKEGIKASDKFILYESNPRNYETESLKAQAGVVLTGSDTTYAIELREKYNVRFIESQEFVTAKIPFRSGISLFAGRIKIYPAIINYKKQHLLKDAPFIEIYSSNKKVQYLSPSHPTGKALQGNLKAKQS